MTTPFQRMRCTQVNGSQVIAGHFDLTMQEVRKLAYQPRRFRDPYVYLVDGAYYCAPNEKQKPPRGDGFDWKLFTTFAPFDDREIYRSLIAHPQVNPPTTKDDAA